MLNLQKRVFAKDEFFTKLEALRGKIGDPNAFAPIGLPAHYAHNGTYQCECVSDIHIEEPSNPNSKVKAYAYISAKDGANTFRVLISAVKANVPAKGELFTIKVTERDGRTNARILSVGGKKNPVAAGEQQADEDDSL